MENIGVSLANFFGGCWILIIGLVLRFVKGSESMIAGYGTMDKTEQAKWNATKMRIFMGKVFIYSSCVLLIGGILALLDFYPTMSVIVSWSVFTAACIFCVIYLNTSSKFKTRQK